MSSCGGSTGDGGGGVLLASGALPTREPEKKLRATPWEEGLHEMPTKSLRDELLRKRAPEKLEDGNSGEQVEMWPDRDGDGEQTAARSGALKGREEKEAAEDVRRRGAPRESRR